MRSVSVRKGGGGPPFGGPSPYSSSHGTCSAQGRRGCCCRDRPVLAAVGHRRPPGVGGDDRPGHRGGVPRCPDDEGGVGQGKVTQSPCPLPWAKTMPWTLRRRTGTQGLGSAGSFTEGGWKGSAPRSSATSGACRPHPPSTGGQTCDVGIVLRRAAPCARLLPIERARDGRRRHRLTVSPGRRWHRSRSARTRAGFR